MVSTAAQRRSLYHKPSVFQLLKSMKNGEASITKHHTAKLTMFRKLLKARLFLTPATIKAVMRHVMKPAKKSGV